MKIFLLTISFMGSVSVACGQGLPELRDMLRMEDGHSTVAKLFHESSPVERQALLANLVTLISNELGGTSQTKSGVSIGNAAAALIAIGDEQAILSSFQSGIENMRPGDESDAVDALATCRDERAVAIIDGLARTRLGRLGEALIQSQDQDERRARHHLLGSFVQLLMGLAKSANPKGIVLAKQLRDDFAARYESDNGKLVVTAIDAELAKVTPPKSSAVDAPSTSTTTSLPSAKPASPPKAPEAKAVTTPAEQPTSSTPWSVVAVLIVAAFGLLWLLVKNRR